MSAHSSSTVQQAREALAARLRDVRLDAGITGHLLAARCGWSGSKSSRIENARTPPSDADIKAWCVACGADDLAADLIASNRQSAEMYVEWRRLQRTGLRRLQESGASLYERTRRFRVYCSDVVPGFLQTPAYAKALLSSIAAFRGTPDDVSDAVAARMRRNSIVRAGDHRLSILLEESVLRYRIGDSETMAGQLRHLLSEMALPSVAVGVIPFDSDRGVWPMATFTIFDNGRVHADSLDAAATLEQPGQIALYSMAFEQLARNAVYGAAARGSITSALNSLGA
ncbi:helix-turn-helix domain-containing protein [Streptomyces sp. NBC_01387]|uniref:helix-turn-helix domain-containing protein n=1 Tax=unclassified Streptomyces TaxID=2593676 RepID=UPI002258CCDE|nr:helix-turn-helix transcriptional regulator [Streptomyces sp. NBC_01500]MCX4550896.1 helix-turn-helix domain-containing protein [Streptomyces sp. NBC_01500]WSV56165.1 helix-turn-helix domain-containing protein [Streptomyces sp. NBC_01014]